MSCGALPHAVCRYCNWLQLSVDVDSSCVPLAAAAMLVVVEERVAVVEGVLAGVAAGVVGAASSPNRSLT